MAMHQQAFKTLGIQPTNDGRAIRAAFVRIARIYHPDRFAGMPDDVRSEAERRMKEASAAYEFLRGAKNPDEKPSVSDAEMRERARKYKEAIHARSVAEEKTRARWRRWEQIEKLARARAEMDAELMAKIREEVDGPTGESDPIHRTPSRPTAPKEKPAQPRRRSAFYERIEEARRGPTDALAPRPKQTD